MSDWTREQRSRNCTRATYANPNTFNAPGAPNNYPPLKLRNEPEEYYHVSKRDPKVSLPKLKFLERD